MRKPIFLALSVSMLLVAGSLVSRFGRPVTYEASLSGVNAPFIGNTSSELTGTIPSGTDTYNTSAQLTTTDLVSRQLLIDYLSLANQGQATQSNIDNLINQHINAVPVSPSPTLSLSDLNLVPDNLSALKKYDSQTTEIEEKRLSSINKAYSDLGNSPSEDSFYKLSQKIGGYYQTAADQLKKIDVPTSVSNDHLRLINNFLSSATTMSAVSAINDDSLATLSGLSAIKDNTDQEKAIIMAISNTLVRNGVQP